MIDYAIYIFKLIIHVGLPHYLLLAAFIFSIGLYGLFTKRGIISVLMCVELMLNAVNINLIAFNHYLPLKDVSGQLMSLFAIAVAAAEVAVGLALAFRIYHDRQTINVDELNKLRG